MVNAIIKIIDSSYRKSAKIVIDDIEHEFDLYENSYELARDWSFEEKYDSVEEPEYGIESLDMLTWDGMYNFEEYEFEGEIYLHCCFQISGIPTEHSWNGFLIRKNGIHDVYAVTETGYTEHEYVDEYIIEVFKTEEEAEKKIKELEGENNAN